jgi:hypothetical protein
MYYGDLFSTVPGVVKGLSAFAFSESTTMQVNQSEEFTMLHIADTTCTTKTIDDIKSSYHKDLVKVPSDYYQLIEALDREEKCLSMFLGKDSLPHTRFAKFVNAVKDCKDQINSLASRDPQIFARVIYSQCLFFQQFARECSICESREDVNEKYLNYEIITFELSVGRCDTPLPNIFKTFQTKPDPTPKRPKTQDEVEEDKHKDKKRKVLNPSQFSPFRLEENENYHDTFTGRDKVSSCPRFASKPICRRWHILGHCFNNCNMSESHVPQDKLNEKQKSEFSSWMKNCRQAAGSA